MGSKQLSSGRTGGTGTTTPGAPGRSAYQIALDEGFVGDESAWAASLVGPAGPGALEAYKSLPGNASKTASDFIDALRGDTGPGTYQTWLTLPGNAAKSEAEFIAEQKGTAGKSALQIAIDAGSVPRPGPHHRGGPD